MNTRLAVLFIIAGFASIALGQTSATEPTTNQADYSSAEPSTVPTTQTAMEDVEPSTGPATQQIAGGSTRPAYNANRYGRNNNSGQGFSRNRRFNQQQPSAQTPLTGATPQPRRMALEFDLLTTRSIFIRGSQVTSADNGFTPRNTFFPPPGNPYVPERSLVFNGVTKSDTATAMVENMDTHEVAKVHIGDSLASGKVTGITLNTLDYEAEGRTTRIEIGQTLAGGTVQSLSAALAGPPTTGPTTYPSNMPMTRQLGETIEAYLRRRHAMGL